jgi:hypothetical protein
MNVRPARRMTAAVLVCLAATLASGVPAHADPGNAINPSYEGSLLDTANIAAAASSDLSSSPGRVTSGCASSATTPQKRPNPSSPTTEEVYSVVTLVAVTAVTCSETWSIQRSRWFGWGSYSSTSVTVGGPGGVAEGTISTACAAGTWSYRVVAASGYHTASGRYTCVDRTDPFYIDQT